MKPGAPTGWAGWTAKATALGGVVGLALFALESWLIARQNLVGVNLDGGGAFAALARVVRPLLPGLLGRVGLLYALGGAVLGGVAAALALCWGPVSPKRRWLLWGGELTGAAFLLFLHRAIERPALVDDVLADRALRWVLNAAEPSLPWVAGGLVVGLHAWVAVQNHGQEALRMAGAVLAAWVFGLDVRPPPAPPVEKTPLVVLIGVDAFRPDRLSREALAPNLRGLVADSSLFTRAYTPIAQTEPAWRSLLTARWPHRTGARYPLTADARWTPLPTFAQAFSDNGFTTSFTTDCSRFNFQTTLSGFQDRRQPPRGAINFLLEKLRYRAVGAFGDNAFGAWLLPEFVDNRAMAGIHDALGYARRLSDRWSSLASQGPALLAFHATAAHFPGDPVYPFYRKYVKASEPPQRRTRMHFATVAPGASGGWSREGAEALYDELLAQADAQVGILVDRLKREGRFDEALIVVFSDHGESFHEDRPDLAGATPVHGARLSDEENRILLAIKWPRALNIAPGSLDALVRLVDLGPTLLDATGLPALPDPDGVSLLPYARGGPSPELVLYAETGFTHVRPDVFLPGHRAEAPRSLDAYDIRADGVVEVKPKVHADIVADKDIAAFDGVGWWIRSPLADGQISERCVGQCSPKLREWLVEIGPILEGGAKEKHGLCCRLHSR